MSESHSCHTAVVDWMQSICIAFPTSEERVARDWDDQWKLLLHLFPSSHSPMMSRVGRIFKRTASREGINSRLPHEGIDADLSEPVGSHKNGLISTSLGCYKNVSLTPLWSSASSAIMWSLSPLSPYMLRRLADNAHQQSTKWNHLVLDFQLLVLWAWCTSLLYNFPNLWHLL